MTSQLKAEADEGLPSDNQHAHDVIVLNLWRNKSHGNYSSGDWLKK